MYLEVCDLCKEREPTAKFKVKMSRRGNYIARIGDFIWGSYQRISICEKCAEKLLGIKSNATIVEEIHDNIQKQTIEIINNKYKQAKGEESNG